MASLAGKVALVTGAAKGSCQRAPRRRPTSPPLTRRRPRRCLMMLSYTFPPEASHEGWLPLPLTRRRPRPPPPAAGIGLACAQALGRAGARVLLADVNAEGAAAAAAALAAEGVDAAAQACDVGDAASVAAAVAAAVARFGRLDVAVANAGIVRAGDFLEMSEADFDTVIRVNLKGTFLAGQAAARQMVAQGGGGYAIVNMGSVNGAMALPTIAGYNASKGGIHNLTRRSVENIKLRILKSEFKSARSLITNSTNPQCSMALSLAPHGIRVNAVAPGSVNTPMLAAVAADRAAMARVLSRTPLLRAAEPAEVAACVRFLASAEASYVTGEILTVDGGRSALNYSVAVPPESLDAACAKFA
jgi:NAD(P)-dependent dehydrogenase (short-subunit alcohol dehydrogenase family)